MVFSHFKGLKTVNALQFMDRDPSLRTREVVRRGCGKWRERKE